MSTSHDTPAPALRGRLPALLLAGSSFRIRLLSRVAGFGFFAIILAMRRDGRLVENLSDLSGM